MNIFYVYVHKRLSSGIPFYVGKGHGSRCHSSDSRNPHWHNIVAKDGGHNVEIVASGMDEELSLLAEVELIDKFRRSGVKLVNMTEGGDGVVGLRHSLETRARLAELSRGNKNSTGRPVSAETRAKLSAINRIAMADSARRARTTEATRRAMQDPKVRAKVARGNANRIISPETRAKMSEARKGRPSPKKGQRLSDVTRAKMAVSAREGWKKRKAIGVST